MLIWKTRGKLLFSIKVVFICNCKGVLQLSFILFEAKLMIVGVYFKLNFFFKLELWPSLWFCRRETKRRRRSFSYKTHSFSEELQIFKDEVKFKSVNNEHILKKKKKTEQEIEVVHYRINKWTSSSVDCRLGSQSTTNPLTPSSQRALSTACMVTRKATEN